MTEEIFKIFAAEDTQLWTFNAYKVWIATRRIREGFRALICEENKKIQLMAS